MQVSIGNILLPLVEGTEFSSEHLRDYRREPHPAAQRGGFHTPTALSRSWSICNLRRFAAVADGRGFVA